MKRNLFLGVAAAALFLTADVGITPSGDVTVSAVPAPAEARYSGGIHFDFFYGSLRSHGRWIHRNPYGWVFIPHVRAGWRPYEYGHWEYDDYYGWVWISDEDFGWATYHYGSWDYDRRIGWYWVPGYDWAPSWVVWRYSDGYIGWAPLLASAIWGLSYYDLFYDPWYGYGGWYSNAHYWCFTRDRDFGHGRRGRIIPVTENHTYIDNSTTIYNTTVVDDRIVARGPDVRDVERRAGHRIERVRVRETDTIEDTRRGGGIVRPRQEDRIATRERIRDRVTERTPRELPDGTGAGRDRERERGGAGRDDDTPRERPRTRERDGGGSAGSDDTPRERPRTRERDGGGSAGSDDTPRERPRTRERDGGGSAGGDDTPRERTRTRERDGGGSAGSDDTPRERPGTRERDGRDDTTREREGRGRGRERDRDRDGDGEVDE